MTELSDEETFTLTNLKGPNRIWQSLEDKGVLINLLFCGILPTFELTPTGKKMRDQLLEENK